MLSANGEGDAPEGRQDAEYQVGDKKPPLHTRFKPGDKSYSGGSCSE